jgi:hypothetical protein
VNLIASKAVTLLMVTTISSLNYLSSVNNDKEKGFCYDHGGDEYYCFEKNIDVICRYCTMK